MARRRRADAASSARHGDLKVAATEEASDVCDEMAGWPRGALLV